MQSSATFAATSKGKKRRVKIKEGKPRWDSKGEDARKLGQLITTGAITPTILTPEYIENNVRLKYPEIFGKYDPERFRENYRRCVKEYQDHLKLSNSRDIPKTVQNEEEEDEEDSTFLPEERSTDSDDDADFTVVSEVVFGELEEQEIGLDLNPTSMKSTSPKPRKEKQVVDLDAAMGNISINDSIQIAHPFNMSVFFDENSDKCVGIFLLCFSGARSKQYQVKVSDDGKTLDVEYTFPNIIFDATKLTTINPLYNSYSSRFQSFNLVADETKRLHKNPIVGIQRFSLPFEVLKEPRDHGLYLFKNSANTVQHFVYSIELRAREKSILTPHRAKVVREFVDEKMKTDEESPI